MNKLSMMMLGACASAATILMIQNKDAISKKMKMIEREGRRTLNKVKQML